jgi:hypothetical protein
MSKNKSLRLCVFARKRKTHNEKKIRPKSSNPFATLRLCEKKKKIFASLREKYKLISQKLERTYLENRKPKFGDKSFICFYLKI